MSDHNNVISRYIIVILAILLIQFELSAQNIPFLAAEQIDSLQGVLNLTTRPDSSEVYINDSFRGRTPLRMNLAPNKYTVVIKKEGFVPSLDTVIIMSNNVLTINDSLLRTPIVNVRSVPSGARVFIDSVFIGRTPIDNLEISVGSHIVKSILSDYHENSREIVAQAGIRQTLVTTLLPTFGFLSIVVSPDDAWITIDSGHVITGSISNVQLIDGFHHVSISHPTYGSSLEKQIFMGPGYHMQLDAGRYHFSGQALFCSILIPGLGQILDESYLKGSLEMIFAFGSIYFLSNSYSFRNEQQSNYELAKTNYNIASTESDAKTARTKLMLAASDLSRAKNRLTASYWALGFAYAFTFVDALLFHTIHRDIVVVNTKLSYPELIKYHDSENIRLGFSYHF